MLISGLAVVFGTQNATARQFGVPELSTTVLTQTVVILIMCSGAVLGATLTLWTVAPVIALAATVVATSAAIFAFGPAGNEKTGGRC